MTWRAMPAWCSMDPSWINAAGRFVAMGFHHILDGTDHLLFLFCLVIPFRRIRPLIPVITAFTIAHSITLIASAYGYAPDAQWFPPLIEMLIAVSIVYMALENIVVLKPQHRWVITFFFGLVHGFGFSWVLRDTLQFAGSHVLLSLLSFNVGVELGQLFMLALFVPALNLLFRYVVPYRVGSIILSAIVAHQAWHWMEDRWDALSQFPMPSITPDNIDQRTALADRAGGDGRGAVAGVLDRQALGRRDRARNPRARGGIGCRLLFARQPLQPRFCLEPWRDFGQCLFHRARRSRRAD